VYALIVAVLHQTVIGALDDGEAEVKRIAHGVDAFALERRAVHRGLVESEKRSVELVETDDGKIVWQVNSQDLELTMVAVRCEIFEPIGFRLEHRLRDHVIVGDGQAISGNQKSRADRRLLPRAVDQRSNLQEPRGRRGIDALGDRGRGPRRRPGNTSDHHNQKQ
jgi:hypothetical protein